jgi:pimeloyl-ACP methyl ester carboxylesterase
MEKFIRLLELKRFSLFVQDYGGPVGFRMAVRHPELIEALIIQNSNAYEEGIGKGFDPVKELWKNRNESTEKPLKEVLTHNTVKFLYVNGEPDPSKVSADAWNMDLYFLSLPGRIDIQIELLYDYRNNLKGYPQLQEYFRKQQPPALVIWGTNDIFFTNDGGTAYKRDLRKIEVHPIEGGHFTLESHGDMVADHIRRFLNANSNSGSRPFELTA